MTPHADATSSQEPGARCARHPTAEALLICSRCGSYACQACASTAEAGAGYCAPCASRVSPVLATRTDRFVAHVLDSMALVLPWLGALFVQDFTSGVSRNMTEGSLAWVGMAGSLAVVSYQFHRAVQTGQTLGKRLRRIRVVRTDGSPVSAGRFLLRNVLSVPLDKLWAPLAVIGIVDAVRIFRRDRRCLHDLLADTRVVEVPATKPGL